MATRLTYGLSLLVVWLFAVRTANAQFRLPPFDVEVKVAEALIPNFNNKDNSAAIKLDAIETTNIYGAAHLQFGQHLGVGWLYSQSFRGTVRYSSDGGQPTPASEKASMLMFGPDIRYTSSKAKKTRFSASVNYLQVEFVDDKGGYRLAHKANTIGLSLGIIKRVSNTIDICIIELGAKAILGEKAFWMDSDMIIEAKTGVIINFSKRK